MLQTPQLYHNDPDKCLNIRCMSHRMRLYDLSIDEVRLYDLSIDEVRLYDLSIDEVRLYDLSIDEVRLYDLSIDEVRLYDLSIDEVRLYDLSIDEVRLYDLSIDEVRLYDLSIDEVRSPPLQPRHPLTPYPLTLSLPVGLESQHSPLTVMFLLAYFPCHFLTCLTPFITREKVRTHHIALLSSETVYSSS